jgi:hypothetical protein
MVKLRLVTDERRYISRQSKLVGMFDPGRAAWRGILPLPLTSIDIGKFPPALCLEVGNGALIIARPFVNDWPFTSCD